MKPAPEAKRNEARRRQLHALESVGVLAAGVAHDFNNLLLGVIGNASLAQQILPADSPASELLDGIVKAGEQGAHLTRQMLAYSGRGDYRLEQVDLAELTGEAVAALRPSLHRGVEILLEARAGLPAVHGDRARLREMLVSLIRNAAEATGAMGGPVFVLAAPMRVDGRVRRQNPAAANLELGRYATVEIRDRGCGMNAAVRARIFEPFFTTKFEGRGLGLSAAHGIVRAHRGAILVKSAPRRGSRFTVLLPAFGAEADAKRIR
ncbi:MAG TPA: ATP-binding protein [Bryobacteraceae bacterium]|nr:ATP-binding protein [Bryobacteraceae bacterium]